MKAGWIWCLLVFSANVLADTCAPGDKQIFWGDLHVHTSFSMDAFVWNNQASPEEAYAFARGEAQATAAGPVRLARPLDFAAVTDHAEYFGAMQQCHGWALDTPFCRALVAAAAEDSPRGFSELFLPALLAGDRRCQGNAAACDVAERSAWQRMIDAANGANEPCRFTAFVANEWTASPENLHWHRNLIYASDVVPERAVNAFDEPTQEAMWQALEARCVEAEGCRVLAIPHNGNIGMGGAFNVEGHDQAMLSLRARFEKLVEIHQHKGNSECFPGSSLSDEACRFESMLPIPLLRALAVVPRELTAEEHAEISRGYVRDTLARGLELVGDAGVNPFRYGFVGATDTHSGRPGDVAEEGWQGAIGTYDANPERRATYVHYNPGGLTAVWARQNTRTAIFEALARREVYATSGPRIGLRFGVSAQGCDGENESVVMGGTYRGDSSPTLVVRAQQDSVPLARVDIIRLTWRNGEIEQHLQQFASDGQADRCVAWSDDEYDATLPTLWYARVLQQPTLRWDGRKEIQERAWSSPIWSRAAIE